MARLLLEDGTRFEGEGYGAPTTRVGEVVFNTSLTGYQEVLTDPSYHEQIVVMTAAHVGNYGVNFEDAESEKIWAAGFACRSFSRISSSHLATGTLQDYLHQSGVPGIHGLDTRALVRHIRSRGAMRAVISNEELSEAELRERIFAWPGMEGRALAGEVSCTKRYTFAKGNRGRIHVLDGGVKRNILRLLAQSGCHIEVFPADSPAVEFGVGCDAVLLSNGPGDPASLTGMIREVRSLLGKVPLLGVCLGHQLLGLALGADTFKLRFGHRGGNHPVRDIETGRVEITSQNHGFCVDPKGIERAGGRVSHVNLNDGTLEGFVHDDLRVICVQFHPEASPGPHDSAHLLLQRYLHFAGLT
jgi:carbamoyl-phosphate synthase small subunit